MANSAATLYPNDAALPSATSVSMFGARWMSARTPLMKKRWLTTITAAASSSCSSPTATGLPAKNAGSGQPHIVCPMDTYISASRKPSDASSRRSSAGVSRSSSARSCSAGAAACAGASATRAP